MSSRGPGERERTLSPSVAECIGAAARRGTLGMRGADAEPRQRERPQHRRSRPRRPRSAPALALGGALCALLCLSVSVLGTADVPLSQWCAEAGLSGADAKFAAEGFHTLAEVVEAELSAADLAEIGLDDAQAKLFFRAFAGGAEGEGEGAGGG